MSAPLSSMTGFGSASSEKDGLHVRADVRSVNQRSLRLHIRSRPYLGALEKKVRDRIAESVSRGQVDVNIELARVRPDPSSLLHPGVAESAIAALRSACERWNLQGDVSVSDLVAVPGVFESVDSGAITEAEFPAVAEALDAALCQLTAMRVEEGAALASVLRGHLGEIASFAEHAGERAPLVVERVRERLQARIEELTSGAPSPADNQALEREILFFADRADIREEVDRLRSHARQFADALDAGGEAGKRLDFLAQEMLREVNTIASKGNDTDIAGAAVNAKLAVERIKEQAANIE